MRVAVSRRLALAGQFVLDELLPPILRDSRWFMYAPMRLILGRHARTYAGFKDRVFSASDTEFAAVYRDVSSVPALQGDTDLNQRCIDQLMTDVVNTTVLEVGCGRGHLSRLLARTNDHVTATDIVIDPRMKADCSAVNFVTSSIDSLPFGDGAFDTVVCTHTLEHVQHLRQAMDELRRVTARRLILVVPRQRPYRFTFSLHVHFFPYRWTLESALGLDDRADVTRLGDWYIVETDQRWKVAASRALAGCVQ